MVTKAKVKQIIFTDKKKDGSPLVSQANGSKFFMLHIELEDGKWVSKFYATDVSKDILPKIKVGETYTFDFKQSGIYFNINSIYRVNQDSTIDVLIS